MISKRLKIAIAYPQMYWGGAEAIVAWMLEALKDRYQVTFISLFGIDFDYCNNRYHTRINNNEINVDIVPIGRWIAPLNKSLSWLQLKSHLLARYIKAQSCKYDAVIWAYNMMDLGVSGIQYVIDPIFNDSLLNIIVPTPQIHLRIYRKYIRKQYYRLCKKLSGFNEVGLYRNLTLADSDWTKCLTEATFNIPTTTVYPPVGDCPGYRAWEDRENGFVHIGRIVPEKNIEQLITILNAVRNKGYDIHFHLAGRFDNPSYKNKILRMANEMGPWIEFTGPLPENNKWELFLGHKYGLNGRDPEPFGIGVAEMINAGCVVFVPARGGQVEIVNHSKLIFSSTQDAIDKITGLLSDKSADVEILNHLKNQVNKFSEKRFVEQIRNIVDTMLLAKDNMLN